MPLGRFAIAALLSLAWTATAGAGPTLRTAWVSDKGSNAAGCGPVAAPCRTFQYAHDNVVVAGGTIFVKDPSNYGSLVVRKAIAIVARGVGPAAVVSPNAYAVSIQAGASDAVLLEGLVLDGEGVGPGGIVLYSAGRLDVVDCTVRGFHGTSNAGRGILVEPSTAATFSLRNTTLVGNRTGLFVTGGRGGSVTGTVTGSSIADSDDTGVDLGTGPVQVALGDTVVDRGGNGVSVGTGSTLVADRLEVTNFRGWGLYLSGGTVWLRRSDITGNSTAGSAADVGNSSGTLYTLGDNFWISGSGATTPYPPK